MTEKFGKGADAGIFGDRTESEEFNRNILKPWQQLRPKEMDFVGVYPVEEIKRDLDLVKKIKNSQDFVDAKTEAAIVAEYALPQLIEDEQLLGNASVSIASEFDDIVRGVDFVLRYNIDGQDFYMGIDVKTSITGRKNDYRIENSRQKILDDVRANRGRNIKYFIDPQDASQGQLELPLMVVVFKNDQILQLRDILSTPIRQRTEFQKKRLKEFEQMLIQELKDNCDDMIKLIQSLMTRSTETSKEKIVSQYGRFRHFLENQ